MLTSESGGRSRLVGRVLLSSNQVLTKSRVCRTWFGSEEMYRNFFLYSVTAVRKWALKTRS